MPQDAISEPIESDVITNEPEIEYANLDLNIDDFMVEDVSLPVKETPATPVIDATRFGQRQDRIRDYIDKDQSSGSTLSFKEGQLDDTENED